MGRIYKYDDDWIRAHYSPDIRWKTLLNEYNKVFGTDIKYPTFVSHMNRELKLQQDYCLPYTLEQDDFLKETYPTHGRVKTTKLFNKRFNDNKNAKAIMQRCTVLGLHVTKERKAESCVENHGRCWEIGAVSSGLFGTLSIKIKNGCGKDNWIRVDQQVIGKKEGFVIVHLDGDKNNCDPDNLIHIPRNILGAMNKAGFWCDNKDIMLTGIKWCELYNVLKNERRIDYDYTEG